MAVTRGEHAPQEGECDVSNLQRAIMQSSSAALDRRALVRDRKVDAQTRGLARRRAARAPARTHAAASHVATPAAKGEGSEDARAPPHRRRHGWQRGAQRVQSAARRTRGARGVHGTNARRPARPRAEGRARRPYERAAPRHACVGAGRGCAAAARTRALESSPRRARSRSRRLFRTSTRPRPRLTKIGTVVGTALNEPPGLQRVQHVSLLAGTARCGGAAHTARCVARRRARLRGRL
jgi:hypothetical protein